MTIEIDEKTESEEIENLLEIVKSLKKIDSALNEILKFKVSLAVLNHRWMEKMSICYEQIAKQLEIWGYISVIDFCIGESHYLSASKCNELGFKNWDKISKIQEEEKRLIKSILSKF